MIMAVSIMAVTWFAFAPSMQCDFTNWDDPTYVTENLLLEGDLSGDHLRAIWREPVSLNYHPLTMYSLALDYKAVGLEPERYHRVNVIIHTLNTLLAFIFVYLLSGRKVIVATIVALFFGIHPMHVESVTWISERKDVLYTFFFLGALIAYYYYFRSKTAFQKGLLYVVCLMLFVASCLSKAVAVVLPVVMLIVDYYLKRKITAKALFEKVPFLIIAVYFGIKALQIQSEGAVGEFAAITLFQRIAFASYGAVMYMVKLFVPFNLSAFHPYPNLDDSGGLPIIYPIMPALFLVVIGLTIWSMKKTRVIAFGMMFYLATVALVLQLISVGNAIMADRYTYVPYLGLLFPIGVGVWRLGQRKSTKMLQYISLAVLSVGAIVFVTQTRNRIPVWQYSETLWDDVIAKYPTRAAVAYKNRGNYYGQTNRLDEAMRDYEVFKKIDKKDIEIYIDIGNVYNLIGQRDNKVEEYAPKAIDAYSHVLSADPNHFSAYLNRANSYASIGRFAEAFDDYDQANRLQPDNRKLHFNRAATYYRYGDYTKAMEDFDWYARNAPLDFSFYNERGRTLFAMSKYVEALRDFEAAVRLDPASGPAFYNASVTAYRMNNLRKALDYAMKAKSLGHTVPDHYLGELQTKTAR